MTLAELQQECCRTALNASRVRALLTLLLQGLYSDANNHDVSFRDALACLKFDKSDPAASALQIGPSHTIRKDTDQFIRVGVRNLEISKRFIGDYAGDTQDGMREVHCKVQLATIVLRHCHPQADIALLMAESSMTFLESCKDKLAKSIPGLLSMDCVTIGEVTTARPEPLAREVVDLTLKLEYQLLLEISTEDHLLKTLGLTITPV